MATQLSFDVDVNALVNDVLGSGDKRNDLVAIVENGTSLELAIAYTVQHGNFANYHGDNPLPGMPLPPPGTKSETPNSYAVGVEAAGAGSNIFLYITAGDNVWGIIFATPANKDNYFKYVYYGWPKAQSDTYNACDGSTKYYANQGPQQFLASNGSTVAGTQINVIMTTPENAPATGQIQFLPIVS